MELDKLQERKTVKMYVLVCVCVFMHAYMNAIYAHTREYACMEEKKTPICILIRVSVCIHKHLSVSAWSINIHP